MKTVYRAFDDLLVCFVFAFLWLNGTCDLCFWLLISVFPSCTGSQYSNTSQISDEVFCDSSNMVNNWKKMFDYYFVFGEKVHYTFFVLTFSNILLSACPVFLKMWDMETQIDFWVMDFCVFTCQSPLADLGGGHQWHAPPPLWVQIHSFSCRFQEQIGQIIGWRRHLWGCPPRLGNPGSVTGHSYLYVNRPIFYLVLLIHFRTIIQFIYP